MRDVSLSDDFFPDLLPFWIRGAACIYFHLDRYASGLGVRGLGAGGAGCKASGLRSTGGQATVSASVDFAAIALACGYAYAASCETLGSFEDAFRKASMQPGPSMIHLHIAPGSMEKLGRPTVGPVEVSRRFRAFLADGPARERAAS